VRITFVLPWAGLAGGIRVVAVYARCLAERGHAVTVISLPWHKRSLRERLRALVRGEGLLLEPREGSHLDGLPIDHRILEADRPIVDADVPEGDVVVATWWETAEWVAALSAAKGAKVHFIQGYDAVSYEGVAPEKAQRVRDGWRLPLDKIVVSQWLADLVRPSCGNLPVTCVPNSVDTQQFFAPPRGKQERPTFGFVYSEAHYKGCDVAIAAVDQVRAHLPGLRILSFGADRPRRLRLPRDCEFSLRPSQSRLREIYASCDGWLFSSRTEGFGLPIVEAMACRTPVVATPAGAAPELLAEGRGILVGMDDAAGMAGAMRRLAGLPDAQWRQLSTRAYDRVRGYSWESAADRCEAALRGVAQRRAALGGSAVSRG